MLAGLWLATIDTKSDNFFAFVSPATLRMAA
jgi:hypothetical protein